jgi:hypothetical protein
VAYRGPHTPLDAPKRYMDRFPGEMPERRRAALAMLSAIDDGVGLITSTLKKHGLTEKTLIFFIGDNGAPLKIHKIDSPLKVIAGGWDGSLNTPLNGEKGMLAEGGMSTPFSHRLARHDPRRAGVRASRECARCRRHGGGVANDSEVKPGELTRRRQSPPLSHRRKQSAPHDALYWRWMAQSAIREGNWKLLRGGDREYLYDLATDREEKHNLAAEHPDKATQLREKLTAWCAELDPPGLALGPMAQTWNDYFDHYLEGKTVAPPAAKSAPESTAVRGWEARGGTLAEVDGVIVFTPEKKRRGGFLAKSRLKLAGPVSVRLELKAPPGTGSVSWRVEGDKDFLPASRASFTIADSADWQVNEFVLPASAPVIHLRVQVPPGEASFRTLQFKPADR